MLTERCTRAPSRTGCEMVRAATSGRRRARTTTGDGRGVSRTGTGSCPSPQARCTKGPTLTAYGTDSALSSTGRAAPSPASGATTSGAARGGGIRHKRRQGQRRNPRRLKCSCSSSSSRPARRRQWWRQQWRHSQRSQPNSSAGPSSEHRASANARIRKRNTANGNELGWGFESAALQRLLGTRKRATRHGQTGIFLVFCPAVSI